MILTVNIGNTHITIGGYEKDCLKFCGRLHSDIACTADEYAIRLCSPFITSLPPRSKAASWAVWSPP